MPHFLPLGLVEDDAYFRPTVHGPTSFWSSRPLAPSRFLPYVGDVGGSNVVASALSNQVQLAASESDLGSQQAVLGYFVDRGPLCFSSCLRVPS